MSNPIKYRESKLPGEKMLCTSAVCALGGAVLFDGAGPHGPVGLRLTPAARKSGVA